MSQDGFVGNIHEKFHSYSLVSDLKAYAIIFQCYDDTSFFIHEISIEQTT